MSVSISNNLLGTILPNKPKSTLDGAPLLKKENISNTDTVEISEEAKEMQYKLQELQRMRETAEQQAEGTEKLCDDMSKALEIFRRIVHGDHVPPQDEEFLMKYNSEMYMAAITARMENKDPKDYESLLDDEKDSTEGISEAANGTESSEGNSDSVDSAEAAPPAE